MTDEPAAPSPEGWRVTWSTVAQSLNRPYRVTLPMVMLVSLVPFYLVIGGRAESSVVHAPALALDRLLPLSPEWSLIYGALYAFLIVLPVFVIRHEELIGRTVRAYLSIWMLAYICFLVYPTTAPRPHTVLGNGFAVWGLRFLYDADPPYNCFPSLHVAHSFVSALACQRVNRTVGFVAISCASLVALSTLYTKQHYVVDVVAGILLALLAFAVFLRGFSLARIPELDRRLAPVLAACVSGLVLLGVACYWVAYRVAGVS